MNEEAYCRQPNTPANDPRPNWILSARMTNLLESTNPRPDVNLTRPKLSKCILTRAPSSGGCGEQLSSPCANYDFDQHLGSFESPHNGSAVQSHNSLASTIYALRIVEGPHPHLVAQWNSLSSLPGLSLSCTPPSLFSPSVFHAHAASRSAPLLVPARTLTTYWPIVGRNFQQWNEPPAAMYRLDRWRLLCRAMSGCWSGVIASQHRR